MLYDAPSTVCELGKRIIMEKVLGKLTNKEVFVNFFYFEFSHHIHLFEFSLVVELFIYINWMMFRKS